jgi:peptidylprolyl isomerase/peptidyl-prolyl cis-trans isomerase B (cyclophilin B)
MRRFAFLVFALSLGIAGCHAREPAQQAVSTAPPSGSPANPRVVLETGKGRITLELFAHNAPATVANFLGYVRDGFYDGTVFHRVIPGFMIQGGGMTAELAEKPHRAPIANEADNGLANLRGTLAMARTQDPHSAAAQFFINVADNRFLDHRGKRPDAWGYAVFGRVIDGMDVVDAIANVPRGERGPFTDVPLEPVLIRHATVIP